MGDQMCSTAGQRRRRRKEDTTNAEAQVPENQTESMTEPQMDGVSGGGSPLSALQQELAVMQQMEQ